MIRKKSVFILVVCSLLSGIFTAIAGLRPLDDTAGMKSKELSAVAKPAEDVFEENQAENLSMRWFHNQKSQKLQGVALVIHGLNLRPDRMRPIIDSLTGAGIDVLSLSLRGHGANYDHRDGLGAAAARLESFKNVSYPLWLNEAYLAYMQVQQRGQQEQVPVFLTAFSIGGLIGLDLLLTNPGVHFDKIVLLAPAISLHAAIYLERLLAPFPRLVIPSLADDAYLANKSGTPVAAYNALFEALEDFEQNAGPKLNLPTLLFIDEQDEFIPLRGLKELVAEHNLDQWQFYIVQKEEKLASGTFHHHILDATSTGEKVWRAMMTATIRHLLGEKAR